MAKLKFLDPRAVVNPKSGPWCRAWILEGKVIGIIDNGQSNSTDMFKELGKLLQERLHVKEVCSRPSRRICKARPNRSWRRSLTAVTRSLPVSALEGRARRGVSTTPSNCKRKASRR